MATVNTGLKKLKNYTTKPLSIQCIGETKLDPLLSLDLLTHVFIHVLLV